MGRAGAQDQVEPPEAEQADPALPELVDVLSPFRTRFDTLVERTIGTTSTPVEFDWRRTAVQFGATGSFLFELNNFDSLRGGGLVRLPSGGLLVEFGVDAVGVWDTPSSRALALTPYRQPGRPPRMEIDFAVGLPLAEGVVTAGPKFFPAVQMVFVGYAGLRYNLYPTGWANLRPGEVVSAILSPTLSEAEITNLEDARLPAMEVDPGRYGVLVGFGNDLYFEPGIFVSPRFSVAIPLLAPVSQTRLLLWADFTIAVGVAL